MIKLILIGLQQEKQEVQIPEEGPRVIKMSNHRPPESQPISVPPPPPLPEDKKTEVVDSTPESPETPLTKKITKELDQDTKTFIEFVKYLNSSWDSFTVVRLVCFISDQIHVCCPIISFWNTKDNIDGLALIIENLLHDSGFVS